MKTLYHVSYQAFELINTFTPRIPLQRANGEDGTIKRVCVSTSLDRCLLANPLTDEAFTPNGYLETNDLTLYEIERDGFSEYGIPIVLYTFHVEDSKVRQPQSIKQYVPDALETDEHWIMENIKPVSHRYFLLEDVYSKDGVQKCFYSALTAEELTRLTPLQSDEYSLC